MLTIPRVLVLRVLGFRVSAVLGTGERDEGSGWRLRLLV